MKALHLILAFAALPAWAGEDAAQLATRRAEIEAQFKSDAEICAQRFVVNACMDAARERRREALKPIAARQLELDAVARRERADAQAQRSLKLQQQAAATEARSLTEPLTAAQAPRTKQPAEPRKVIDPVQLAAQRQADIDAAEARAARNREKQAQNQARRLERREQAAREAGRPAAKAAAARLPTPSAAEIAALAASAASR